MIQNGSTKYHICRMATLGRFVFRFEWLYQKPPFHDEAVRRELLRRINEIPGVHFGDDVLTKRAGIPFADLANPVATEKLKEAVAWVIERAKQGATT